MFSICNKHGRWSAVFHIREVWFRPFFHHKQKRELFIYGLCYCGSGLPNDANKHEQFTLKRKPVCPRIINEIVQIPVTRRAFIISIYYLLCHIITNIIFKANHEPTFNSFSKATRWTAIIGAKLEKKQKAKMVGKIYLLFFTPSPTSPFPRGSLSQLRALSLSKGRYFSNTAFW